jgi:hypothetical protein
MRLHDRCQNLSSRSRPLETCRDRVFGQDRSIVCQSVGKKQETPGEGRSSFRRRRSGLASGKFRVVLTFPWENELITDLVLAAFLGDLRLFLLRGTKAKFSKPDLLKKQEKVVLMICNDSVSSFLRVSSRKCKNQPNWLVFREGLTPFVVESGRRDLNPRPSPWQEKSRIAIRSRSSVQSPTSFRIEF